MQRKLAELIVDVEAAQALVFDGYDPDRRLRIGAPLIKLRAARLGITAASDAIEVHGGNGYVENWPVARILRDAQVNTLWEGPDNILCLDVRRGIEREQADVAFLDRLRAAVEQAPTGDDSTVELVRRARRAARRRHRAVEARSTAPTAGGAALPPGPAHGRRLRRRPAARAGRLRAARARLRPQDARRPAVRPAPPRRPRPAARHRRAGTRSSTASRTSGTAPSWPSRPTATVPYLVAGNTLGIGILGQVALGVDDRRCTDSGTATTGAAPAPARCRRRAGRARGSCATTSGTTATSPTPPCAWR